MKKVGNGDLANIVTHNRAVILSAQRDKLKTLYLELSRRATFADDQTKARLDLEMLRLIETSESDHVAALITFYGGLVKTLAGGE